MALLAYNRKKQILAPDVEGLIKHLTGFEEDDKNYQEVAKFTYSNIIHHNFATVDINSIQRSIEGIIEKFKIHGLNRRANALKELVDKYVSSDSTDHSQLNVQWHVLLVLLKLSYNPTSVPESELAVTQHVSEPLQEEEDINWPIYLNEGYEEFACPSDCSEEEEELWQSDSDDELLTSLCCSSHIDSCDYETSGYCGIPHPSLWNPPASLLSNTEAMRKIFKEAVHSEEWLQLHVQHSWWNDLSCHSVPESSLLTAHMYDMWDQYISTKYKRDSSPLLQTQVVSEFKILQEVLWMLHVPTETSLFRLKNDHFSVKHTLSLPSTVPDSLRLILEGLCPYFDMINNLKKFEEELKEHEMSENPPLKTYKAYSVGLLQQLNSLTQSVLHIENRLNKQEETMTLMSVVEELAPGLNKLQYLYNVHNRAVMDWHSQPPWLCATRLLSVLYEALLEASDQTYLEASLNIFVQSFHVYLYIIDIWLSEGRLEDWCNEFFVIRKGGEVEVMPYQQEMKKCGVLPVPLLTKLMTVMRDAGHTIEVVSQLNKLRELRDIVHNKGCLFKEFSDNVFNEVNRLTKNIKVEHTVGTDIPADTSATYSDENGESYRTCGEASSDDSLKSAVTISEGVILLSTTDSHNYSRKYNTFPVRGEGESGCTKCESPPKYLQLLSNNAMYDQTMRLLLDNNPLLTKALSSYVQPDELRPDSPPPESLHSANMVGVMPLHSVLEQQLELIFSRHRTASRLVTQILLQQYNLLLHFTVLRSVFLMESGNLAQIFYTHLFKEIEAGSWSNSWSLSVHLQFCVEEFHPGFGNCFSLLVKKGGNKTDNVYEAVPTISLAYRVDWPMSIIITQEAIDSYNKVFRFLLYLKYASWTLQNMHFTDISSSNNTLRVRRLQVLKFWMYHSTNTLHAYFMRQVLRRVYTHLEQSVSVADSIDDIIKAHTTFLNEVKVHCLQDKKSHVEKFIMKLLALCSTLSDHWRKEAANSLTDSEIQQLEKRYMTIYFGLVHCLDVITEDGDTDSFLSELKSELSYSIPEPCYDN